MLNNNFYLRENDLVFYVELTDEFAKTRGLESTNLLRVENIDGRIKASLLPASFSQEIDSDIIKLHKYESVAFYSDTLPSVLLIKQLEADSAPGIYMYDLVKEANENQRFQFFASIDYEAQLPVNMFDFDDSIRYIYEHTINSNKYSEDVDVVKVFPFDNHVKANFNKLANDRGERIKENI